MSETKLIMYGVSEQILGVTIRGLQRSLCLYSVSSLFVS